jgi:hypothetical protein
MEHLDLSLYLMFFIGLVASFNPLESRRFFCSLTAINAARADEDQLQR